VVDIADYFSVPMDYLCGRCTEEQAQKFFEGYNFNDIRRAAYDKYIGTGPQKKLLGVKSNSKIEAPWPYNIFQAVFDEPVRFVIDDDKMNALEYALNQLTAKEKEAAVSYFRDNMSQSNIAKKQGVTRSYSNQCVRVAIQKLRGFKNILSIGLHAAQTDRTLQEKIEELKDTAQKYEANVKAQQAEIKSLNAEIADPGKKVAAETSAGSESDGYCFSKANIVNVLDMDIDVLELSTRANNCLRRSGCMTVRETALYMKNNRLMAIGFMGKQTADEIQRKMNALLSELIICGIA
jgi:predicted DNA-binding protein YlxM (UPF0122 family)